MSYYRVIEGHCFDHRILDLADRGVREQPDRHLSELDIQQICQTVLEENGVLTELEVKTLRLVQERYPLTAKAREWLSVQTFPMADLHDIISRVSADRLDFFHLDTEIDEEDVAEQGTVADFEEALIKALLVWRYPARYEGWIPLAPLFEDDDEESDEDAFKLVSSGLEGLNEAIVYLVPAEAAALNDWEYPYPLPPREELDTEQYWIFGFHIEYESDLALFAYVSRTEPENYFCRAHYIGGLTMQDRLGLIADHFMHVEDLEVYIDEQEVALQQERFGGQISFSSIFYYAISEGLLSGEGSLSFKELAAYENWLNFSNLSQSFELITTRYLDFGRIYLIPVNWAEQKPGYQLPHWFAGDFSQNWYFMMEFPDLTHHRFIINVSRRSTYQRVDMNSTSYVAEHLGDTQTQIELVIRQEFKLQSLSIGIDNAEFERQHLAYDPFWREPAMVIRQVVNTLLNDFSSTASFLSAIVEVFPHILLENADDPSRILNGLAQKAMECMDEATLYLLPEDIYQRDEYSLGEYLQPNRQESVSENYLFQLTVPMLEEAPVFFIIIPRDGGLLQQSYNYINGDLEDEDFEDDDEDDDDDDQLN